MEGKFNIDCSKRASGSNLLEINRKAHPEGIDPISYIGGRNRLRTPKGWIMLVDSFNEGNLACQNLASETSLLTLLEYGPSSPKLISSLSEFGRSATVANCASAGSSQYVFK